MLYAKLHNLMHPRRDLAIVLRSIVYEERHRIVTALTEQHGVVSALAKNAIQSRRFGGTLDIFAASEWHFTLRPNADLCMLSEAHIREPFAGLRGDFTKLAVGSALNELILKMAPQHESSLDLFKLHSNALSVLSTAPDGSELAILNAYLAKLLQWSGSQPRLHSCLQCGVELESLAPQAEMNCLVADAGWVCPDCCANSTRHIQGQSTEGQKLHHTLLKLNKESIQDFQLSLSIPIKQVPQKIRVKTEKQRELFQFLEGLLIYHIPGFDRLPIKSLRFIPGTQNT